MKRTILLSLSAATAAGLLFVNVYNSVVDAANWNAALSHSITTARDYFQTANPGTFFRVMSPLNQALSVIALISLWKYGRIRYIAIASLLLAVSVDAFTFGYFYPRNEIIFRAPLSDGIEHIQLAVQQWTSMNWVRSFLCALDTILCFTALVLTAKRTSDVSLPRPVFSESIAA